MFKAIRDWFEEDQRKQLEKKDRRYLKMEARLLQQSDPSQPFVVTRVTTPIMKDLVIRGWEVAAWPNQARVSYTLRIPRKTLEVRIHAH